MIRAHDTKLTVLRPDESLDTVSVKNQTAQVTVLGSACSPVFKARGDKKESERGSDKRLPGGHVGKQTKGEVSGAR